MGVISSDLKHELENVQHLDNINNEILFPKPLKIRVEGKDDFIQFLSVKKIGKTIKLCSINDNITLSNTHFMLQWYVFRTLRSMSDSRYPFDLDKVYEVERIFSKRD